MPPSLGVALMHSLRQNVDSIALVVLRSIQWSAVEVEEGNRASRSSTIKKGKC
jgi:hypothetical protein